MLSFIFFATDLYGQALSEQQRGYFSEAAAAYNRLAMLRPRTTADTSAAVYAAQSALCYVAAGDFVSARREIEFEIGPALVNTPLNGTARRIMASIESGDQRASVDLIYALAAQELSQDPRESGKHFYRALRHGRRSARAGNIRLALSDFDASKLSPGSCPRPWCKS